MFMFYAEHKTTIMAKLHSSIGPQLSTAVGH